MSNYETLLKKIFLRNGLKFEQEKTFSDLRGGKYRFDFYFSNYKGIKIVVEMNGAQHYKIVPRFHKTRQDFLSAQERDRRKISWCLANGIKIYCIPFWEIDNIKNLEDIFQNKFLAKSKWKNDEDWKIFQARK